MKKLLIVPLMMLALGLAGCGTLSDGGPTSTATTTSTQITNTIAQVQNVTKQVCAFVPTAQTVAGILNVLGVPGVSMVADIAQQICGAVQGAKATNGAVPKVAGVRIRGKFVR